MGCYNQCMQVPNLLRKMNLILHPDNVEVLSHANAYSVRRSDIEYSHMVTPNASWSSGEDQLANSRLQKVERLLSNEQAKKRRDREVWKDGKPLVRGWDG